MMPEPLYDGPAPAGRQARRRDPAGRRGRSRPAASCAATWLLGRGATRASEALAPALDVEHVAMARRVAPSRLLPGAQAPPGLGDGVVGPQPPLGGVEQVHAPGVGVTMLLCHQEVAVRRLGIDAGQHGCCTLEDLVV